MGLTTTTFARLRNALTSASAARELEGKLGGYGNQDWFVSSVKGVDGGSFDGKSWAQPFATIDNAINKATASNGDRIIVMPGHVETISTPTFITCDVVGIEIIGVGRGTDRPTLTFDTGTDSTIVMSAANVTWHNFHFINTQDALVVAFPVTAAYCGFFDCEFQDAGADNTIEWITLSTAADYFDLIDCTNRGTDTAGNTAFITGAAADHVTIINLRSQGDFSAANIDMSAAWTDCRIQYCLLENANGVDVGIEGFASATGWVTHNEILVADSSQTTGIKTQGALYLSENRTSNEDGENSFLLLGAGQGS